VAIRFASVLGLIAGTVERFSEFVGEFTGQVGAAYNEFVQQENAFEEALESGHDSPGLAPFLEEYERERHLIAIWRE
jgi:hypothetical protein